MRSKIIPNVIQKSILAALASQPLDPQKQPPISNRELFLRRLRLIKILGASFAKNRFLNHVRYSCVDFTEFA